MMTSLVNHYLISQKAIITPLFQIVLINSIMFIQGLGLIALPLIIHKSVMKTQKTPTLIPFFGLYIIYAFLLVLLQIFNRDILDSGRIWNYAISLSLSFHFSVFIHCGYIVLKQIKRPSSLPIFSNLLLPACSVGSYCLALMMMIEFRNRSLDNISIIHPSLNLIGQGTALVIAVIILLEYFLFSSKTDSEKDPLNQLDVQDFGFSPREKQVYINLINGTQYKKIAEMLHVSESTVKTHANRILRKANCKSRLELMQQHHDHQNGPHEQPGSGLI